MVLDLAEEMCYTEENNAEECVNDDKDTFYSSRQDLLVIKNAYKSNPEFEEVT